MIKVYKSNFIKGVMMKILKKSNKIAPMIFMALHSFYDLNASQCNVDLRGSLYKNLLPRNQGKHGNCFAYSASDLISAKLKTSDRFDVFALAINAKYGVNGGNVEDVLEKVFEAKEVCKDTGSLSRLFSLDQGIVNSFMQVLSKHLKQRLPMLFHISANSPEGVKETKRVVEELRKLQHDPNKRFRFPISNRVKNHIEIYHRYSKKVRELKRMSKRSAQENADLSFLINQMDVQAKLFERAIAENYNMLHSSIFFKAPPEKKADIFYLAAQRFLNDYNNIMQKHYLDKAMISNVYELAKAWFYYDEKTKSYPNQAANFIHYQLKKLVKEECKYGMTKINQNLKAKSLHYKTSQTSKRDLLDKIQDHLKSKKQPLSISIKAKMLQSRSTENHAVNVIGCRSHYGRNQYLIHNSWGTSCSNYNQNLRADCSQGRVWVDENLLEHYLHAVQWIE